MMNGICSQYRSLIVNHLGRTTSSAQPRGARLHRLADEEYTGHEEGIGVSTPSGSTGIALPARWPVHIALEDCIPSVKRSSQANTLIQ